MAHYAFINQDNMVTEVIVGRDEGDGGKDWEQHYAEFRPGQRCLRTSYNTRAGVHLEEGTPFRKNYAGIGYFYDEARDAFIPPMPFPSWILDEETCIWKAPVDYPTGGGQYMWNEEAGEWTVIEMPVA
jgi:hypothetical protein